MAHLTSTLWIVFADSE